ncbi:MAG: hypothetical protein GYA23_10145 [Methanomicrobiales archaeon]|nr:hypothetical protein [Methanomicrobiales archaeon]
MAFEYMINQPCKVKDTLTPEGLRSLVKNQGRCIALATLLRKQGKTDEEILRYRFKVQEFTPSGTEVQEPSIRELLESIPPLKELEHHCTGCPANMGGAFGCYRNIRYPVTEKAEGWLAGITQKAWSNSGIARMPVEWILDKNLTGGIITQMRADPKSSYFERKDPVEIPVTLENGLFRTRTITTDQVLNLLMGLDRMQKPLMLPLLYFSGGLSFSEEEPKPGMYPLVSKWTDDTGKVSWALFHFYPVIGEDDSTRMFKDYFRALFMAYCLDRDVYQSV